MVRFVCALLSCVFFFGACTTFQGRVTTKGGHTLEYAGYGGPEDARGLAQEAHNHDLGREALKRGKDVKTSALSATDPVQLWQQGWNQGNNPWGALANDPLYQWSQPPLQSGSTAQNVQPTPQQAPPPKKKRGQGGGAKTAEELKKLNERLNGIEGFQSLTVEQLRRLEECLADPTKVGCPGVPAP